MKHACRVAPLVVGPALLLLISIGVLDLSQAVWLGFALEVGLWALGMATVVTVWRRMRRERAGGRNGWEALERGLAEVLPRRVVTLMLAELRVYRALARGITRKAPPPAGQRDEADGR
ncbi:MAG: hypothetical protein ACRDJE_29870 [Dehalococcoidia bacterium]